MQDILKRAEKVATLLKQRGETVAIAESSSGGLIAAALLSVAGASAYFLGGTVVYTLKARRELLGLRDEAFAGLHGLTEAGALILARAIRERLSSTWSISEIGAAGPAGNRYGNAAGHSCIAVAGPTERSITLQTGSDKRLDNMYTFAGAALDLLAQSME